MTTANVKLLGYMPDVDPTVVGVITNCSGVVPTYKGFAGAPSPLATPLAALAATCQGSAALEKIDGTIRIIAGAPTKLYEAGTSTWADVSRSATYTISSTSRWRFAQQGDVSFAVNGSDTMQTSVSSGAFSCVASGPVAAMVETVNQFVFAANTKTDARQIQWSALGDYTTWTASIASQAGNNTLTDTPGPITAIRKFGNAIVVYKQQAMYLGINVGPPNIWDFGLIVGVAGAMSQEAVVDVGMPDNPRHIFMGWDDFYMYDGAKPVPIGTARVKQAVFAELLQSRYYACAALHDRVNNRVYFYYPTQDSQFPDKCVVYNYRTDKWGRDDRQIEAVTSYSTPGITWDSLGGTYSTWDQFPNVAWDFAFQNDSAILPAIFDTTHNLKTLTGAAGTTSITTCDHGEGTGVYTAQRVRPIFLKAPASATLTNYYKMNEGDSLTQDLTTSLDSGKFDLLRGGRWHRFQMNMVGDWEMAQYALQMEPSGSE